MTKCPYANPPLVWSNKIDHIYIDKVLIKSFKKVSKLLF